MASSSSPEIQELPQQQTPKPNPLPPPTLTLLKRHKSAQSSSGGGFSFRNLVKNRGGCMPSLTSADDGSQQRRKGKHPAEQGCVGPARRMAGKSGGVSWGSSFVRGERETMEDYCANVRGLMKMTCREFGGCSAPDTAHARKKAAVHYFGVFDGHRGHQVSEYCANVLHDMVVEEWEKQASEDVAEYWAERWRIAFCRAFKRADEAFKGRTLEVRFPGSTASVVLISPCQIIASNCGDSKSILCRSKEVVPLTFDHKPNRKEEADRIESIGGKILRVNGLRVEGVLAMTRAIGDHDLKPFVISTPDVTFIRRRREDEFLVLGSDGLWDVVSIEMVARFARNRLLAYKSIVSRLVPATTVAEDLVHKALINNSKDNITVTVVDLKPHSRSKRCY